MTQQPNASEAEAAKLAEWGKRLQEIGGKCNRFEQELLKEVCRFGLAPALLRCARVCVCARASGSRKRAQSACVRLGMCVCARVPACVRECHRAGLCVRTHAYAHTRTHFFLRH